MNISAILLTSMMLLLAACSASSISTDRVEFGAVASEEEMMALIDEPGPISFTKYTAANWQVPLSGLLNLDHPKAVAEGIEDRPEDIKIFVYVLRHPQHGTFLIDSGVSTRFTNPQGNPDISWLVEQVMQTSSIEVLLTTDALIEHEGSIAGVFLTHIHHDHIMGVSDIEPTVPVYTGPNESNSTSIMHMVTQGTTNRLLSTAGSLRELKFGESGLLDIFGDGSLWAIHSPGHTPGTMAFLARTTQGTHLMLGDVTHTRWGWDNGVEPGSYSKDGGLNAISLMRLRKMVEENPSVRVHPGHQD